MYDFEIKWTGLRKDRIVVVVKDNGYVVGVYPATIVLNPTTRENNLRNHPQRERLEPTLYVAATLLEQPHYRILA